MLKRLKQMLCRLLTCEPELPYRYRKGLSNDVFLYAAGSPKDPYGIEKSALKVRWSQPADV